jgi:hypothetical protein
VSAVGSDALMLQRVDAFGQQGLDGFRLGLVPADIFVIAVAIDVSLVCEPFHDRSAHARDLGLLLAALVRCGCGHG